jgi:hypothetical protein
LVTPSGESNVPVCLASFSVLDIGVLTDLQPSMLVRQISDQVDGKIKRIIGDNDPLRTRVVYLVMVNNFAN